MKMTLEQTITGIAIDGCSVLYDGLPDRTPERLFEGIILGVTLSQLILKGEKSFKEETFIQTRCERNLLYWLDDAASRLDIVNKIPGANQAPDNPLMDLARVINKIPGASKQFCKERIDTYTKFIEDMVRQEDAVSAMNRMCAKIGFNLFVVPFQTQGEIEAHDLLKFTADRIYKLMNFIGQQVEGIIAKHHSTSVGELGHFDFSE